MSFYHKTENTQVKRYLFSNRITRTDFNEAKEMALGRNPASRSRYVWDLLQPKEILKEPVSSREISAAMQTTIVITAEARGRQLKDVLRGVCSQATSLGISIEDHE